VQLLSEARIKVRFGFWMVAIFCRLVYWKFFAMAPLPTPTLNNLQMTKEELARKIELVSILDTKKNRLQWIMANEKEISFNRHDLPHEHIKIIEGLFQLQIASLNEKLESLLK
jgi:uncharacterized membrane protein